MEIAGKTKAIDPRETMFFDTSYQWDTCNLSQLQPRHCHSLIARSML